MLPLSTERGKVEEQKIILSTMKWGSNHVVRSGRGAREFLA
jgi:hypothetical protein